MFGASAMKIAAMPRANRTKMQIEAREIVSIPLTAPYRAIAARIIAIDHLEAAGSIVFSRSARNMERLNVFRIKK